MFRLRDITGADAFRVLKSSVASVMELFLLCQSGPSSTHSLQHRNVAN